MKNETNNSKDGEFFLNLIPDEATSKDYFGIHTKISQTIIKTIRSDLHKPYVIGLFGGWGSGKSSIVKIIKETSSDLFPLIYIDSWCYDKDNFLRHFIKNIANELLCPKQAKEIVKKVSEKTTKQDSKWNPTVCAYISFSFFIILIGILIWWLYNKSISSPEFPEIIGNIIFLALAATFLQFIIPRFTKTVNQSITEITLEDPIWFRNIYNNIIAKVKTKHKQICIVIDNLDRLAPDDALKIIKVIKTFIIDTNKSSNKVVFLIPCDDKQLASRIKLQNRLSDPYKFLEKFFNITLYIPKLWNQDTHFYISSLLNKSGFPFKEKDNSFDSVVFIIQQACSETPRAPKHFINHFITKYRLATHFDQISKHIVEHPDWFAIFVALESVYHCEEIPNNTKELINEANAKDSNKQYVKFIKSIISFVKNIDQNVWFSFHYLKEPNYIQTTPNARKLILTAKNLDKDIFVKLFVESYPDNQQLVSDLWLEMKNSVAKINLANCLLCAIEKNETIKLPIRIIHEIHSFIINRNTGWEDFQVETTYKSVLKEFPDAINKILNIKIVNNKTSEERPKLTRDEIHFLLSLVKIVVCNNNNNNNINNVGIINIVENYGEREEDFVAFMLEHPEYPSINIIKEATNIWCSGKKNINLEKILNYVIKTQEYIEETLPALLGAIINAVPKLLSEKRNQGKKIYEQFLNEINILLQLFETNKLNAKELDFGPFYQSLTTEHTSAAKVSGIAYFHLVAILIHLSKTKDLNIDINQIINTAKSFACHFLTTAEEDAVISFLKEFGEYVEKNLQDNLYNVSDKSPKIIMTIYRHYKDSFYNIIQKLSENKSESLKLWLENYANKISAQARNDILVILIKNSTANSYNIYYYKCLNFIVSTSHNIELISSHFDDLINAAGDLSTPENLEYVIIRMQKTNYKPNKEQKQKLKKGAAAISMSTFPKLKEIIDDIFA